MASLLQCGQRLLSSVKARRVEGSCCILDLVRRGQSPEAPCATTERASGAGSTTRRVPPLMFRSCSRNASSTSHALPSLIRSTTLMGGGRTKEDEDDEEGADDWPRSDRGGI